MMVSAKDMHYTTDDGRQVLDGTAGLWCCNAGHGRPKIIEAVQKQVAELDYAPAFQLGHPKVFELATELTDISPASMNHVFFTNSGSESVETALKMAIAYHRARGDGSRTRLIGRERGYHGVNFGGISVGGIVSNRKMFGTLLGGVDHIRHTHDIERNAYSRGLPEHGAELADDLERLVALHDASTIAAVIVEPMAGSTGVLMPPVGYLQRLRDICDKHGILLIFDEVITGFGRLGGAFSADVFGVVPDMMTTAKGLTSGVIPMGAVFVRDDIHDAFMTCAAALGTLQTYREEGLLTRAAELAPYWEERLHAMRGLPHVIDIRNYGLIGAVELEPIAGEPTKRAFTAFLNAFENDLLIRTTGDIIALSPPLIISKDQIDFLFDTLSAVIKKLD